MPRTERIVIPGCPHHVTQRDNNRQDVFFVDDDRRRYLAILAAQADRFGLTVHGYCLMDNHVHLVVTPDSRESLAKAVGRTHCRYARYVNALHGRSGHLWRNRFLSCALDDGHFWRALAYVERKAVRAKRVRRAWRYRWPSAASHCEVAGVSVGASDLLDLSWWRSRQTAEAWREVLTAGDDPAELTAFRRGLDRGRPLGTDRFIAKLEIAPGRRLRPRPPGRPRKASKAAGEQK